jgi:hypothetical protein
VLERWREYFKQLKNPLGKTLIDNTLAANINNTECDILIADVKRVVK